MASGGANEVERHGDDQEDYEKEKEQQLQPSFYNCYASKQGKIYKCPCLISHLHLWVSPGQGL